LFGYFSRHLFFFESEESLEESISKVRKRKRRLGVTKSNQSAYPVNKTELK
jgi:hypothetical protein